MIMRCWPRKAQVPAQVWKPRGRAAPWEQSLEGNQPQGLHHTGFQSQCEETSKGHVSLWAHLLHLYKCHFLNLETSPERQATWRSQNHGHQGYQKSWGRRFLAGDPAYSFPCCGLKSMPLPVMDITWHHTGTLLSDPPSPILGRRPFTKFHMGWK